jgi:hypothetical protein
MKPSIKLIKPSFYLTNQIDFGIMIAELYKKIQIDRRKFTSASEVYNQEQENDLLFNT